MKRFITTLTSILLINGVTSLSHAGLITHTDYTSGGTITASGQNSNENTIVNEINGNLNSANIAVGGVDTSNLSSTVQAQFVPTATIFPYAGSSAPTGYLIANGQAVSRTTYAALFNIVGTTYGAGDAATTFNVPNVSSRTVFGLAASGNFNSLGLSGGTTSFALTTDSQGAHTHSLGTNGTKANQNDTNGTYDVGTAPNAAGLFAPAAGGGSTLTIRTANTTSNGAHTHSVVNTDNTPPYIVLNYIIKY